MELAFQKTIYPCLQQVKWEVQNGEQTQEIRIDDDLPDIGRVLCAWGQVLLRGKEWRGDEMRISAGVIASVLYAPEDGSEPRCVETWIPLQMKWDLADPQRDGTILAHPLLRGVDARNISARRLMVRASVSVLGEAVVPGEMTVYTPDDLPEDVQVLKNRYPMELPAEAGEKLFSLEEELQLPAGSPQLSKVLYYTLRPQIADEKVMTDKVVFRGAVMLHILYRGEDGNLYTFDTEIPFSQFGELEHDYDPDASATVIPAVTGMDLVRSEEGKWVLKMDLTAQYVIYNRPVIDVVEDVYSTRREVTPAVEQVPVTAVLERSSQTVTAEQTVQADISRVVDICFLPEHGAVLRNDGSVDVNVPGTCQLLYLDGIGDLQSMEAKWEENWDMPASENCRVTASVRPCGNCQASVGGGSVLIRGDVCVDTVTTARQPMAAVKSIELGQETAPDPARPSLILRRCGQSGLWDVAKSCRTTVEAICKANNIQQAPEDDRVLLIPIP